MLETIANKIYDFVRARMLLCVQLFVATLWTAACQAPLSTEFSRQWVAILSSRGSS